MWSLSSYTLPRDIKTSPQRVTVCALTHSWIRLQGKIIDLSQLKQNIFICLLFFLDPLFPMARTLHIYFTYRHIWWWPLIALFFGLKPVALWMGLQPLRAAGLWNSFQCYIFYLQGSLKAGGRWHIFVALTLNFLKSLEETFALKEIGKFQV